MAIVRVDFSARQNAGLGTAVGGVIDATMRDVLGVPPQENYIVCQAHPEGAIFHAPELVSPERLEKIVFIQITLNQGRSAELKARFFGELSRNLAATGHLRPENIYINLVEVARENWSFGCSFGEAGAS